MSKLTDDRADPQLTRGMDTTPTDEAPVYLVLSEAERRAGFVRPVRQVYVHDVCGRETTMSLAIAETYARDPRFYGNTYCATCRMHRPVGEFGEFAWTDGGRVGT